MEHCAAAAFPNHNPRDRLQIAGAYGPPDTEHPPYTKEQESMTKENRNTNIATLIMGDLNMNAWESAEEGAYQEWLDASHLREISDPMTPTYRTGTTTDGGLFAQSDYTPGGILPQDVDRKRDGGYPNVYPAASDGLVLADHHALQLDLYTAEQKKMPRTEKYNINTTNAKQRKRKNADLQEDPQARTMEAENENR